MPVDAPSLTSTPPATDDRLDDLTQIIRAYNQVTDNLRRSHDVLGAEVVRLRNELASTDAQLQRSRRLAALGEMAAGIAHEIRNPLAAIHLYARMIGDDLSAATAGVSVSLSGCADVARKIADAVRGLNGIVNDVLTFSREITPRPQWTTAHDLLDRAIEAHQPAIEAAGVRVQRDDLQHERDLTLRVDPGLMHQAMLNLVRNAVEAMSQTGGTIRLDAQRRDDQVVLTIADSGPGIAPEDVDRIFNPFFTTRNTGTGLGLAIVHRIVDAHRGAIAVHNDGGAVFELVLPMKMSCAHGTGGRAADGARKWESDAVTNEASDACVGHGVV